jgi:mRNA interferase MazF
MRRGSPPAQWFPKRGEICLFSLDKERPALVISSDLVNRHALDVCVVPISSVEHRAFSLRPKLRAGEGGLKKDSWAKCDQVTTIPKGAAVYPPLGALEADALRRVELAVRLSLEL